MAYEILIGEKALSDIQQASDYYNRQQKGLGKKFKSAVEKQFLSVSKNPFYQIRYSNIRCLPVKKFPFMIHFFIDEKNKKAFIVSILHTAQNPEDNPFQYF